MPAPHHSLFYRPDALPPNQQRQSTEITPNCHELLVEILFINLWPDLPNILQQSYDNAEVTIDLQQSSNLQNIL